MDHLFKISATPSAACSGIHPLRSAPRPTLALGIGATTAIFTVVNAVVFRPLAVDRPDRLVAIVNQYTTSPRPSLNVSAQDFEDWQAQSRSFRVMARYQGGETSIMLGNTADYAVVHLRLAGLLRCPGSARRGRPAAERRRGTAGRSARRGDLRRLLEAAVQRRPEGHWLHHQGRQLASSPSSACSRPGFGFRRGWTCSCRRGSRRSVRRGGATTTARSPG